MAAADRFSILPDDLLIRVIFLLPTREAARTTVLSRRWRPLWLAVDALNLDSSSYGDLEPYQLKERLFSDAVAALRPAGRCPVTKLSLFINGPDDKYCKDVMSHSTSTPSPWIRRDPSYDLLADLLAVQEVRRIEELRLDFYYENEANWRYVYQLDPAVLPSNTLRVLDLACSCILLPRGGGAAFLLPRLSVLRLRRCWSEMKDLEDFFHATPCLDSLHIERQHFHSCRGSGTSGHCLTLRCPTVTTLTLARLRLGNNKCIEVDAPCLHTFKYEGHFVDFSMKSPATELARVELAFKVNWRPFYMPEKPWFGPFWRFIGNFRNAKILKLKVPNIEGIALGKDGQHDHLVPLLSLQGLRLEGPCDPGRRGDATVALANLLHCCPMMNSLQIQIVNSTNHYDRRGREPAPDFGVSLDLFEGNFTAMIDAADGSSQVADLPGLSGCEFDCLRYHLKNVKLEFELNLKELNTFEVSLAKFFAENCLVLENLQIDDIKHNFYSHINWMVDRWRADALEQRKQMKQDSAN